jgi:type IV secretory pathway VirB10-like protein
MYKVVEKATREAAEIAARDATDKAVQEAENEKLEISRDLNNQLLKVRSSIVETVTAYSEVSKSIASKLPTPPEMLEIEGESAPTLDLELKDVTPGKPVDAELQPPVELDEAPFDEKPTEPELDPPPGFTSDEPETAEESVKEPAEEESYAESDRAGY